LSRNSATAIFIEYGTRGYDVSSIDKETFLPIEIGSRGDLTPDRAQAAAEFFRKVVARVGPGRIYIHIAGYDEDPRELWDIYEAADYVRLFSRLAGVCADRIPIALHDLSIACFAACGAFGEAGKAAVNPPAKVTEQ
jgi:hypothetical protein